MHNIYKRYWVKAHLIKSFHNVLVDSIDMMAYVLFIQVHLLLLTVENKSFHRSN